MIGRFQYMTRITNPEEIEIAIRDDREFVQCLAEEDGFIRLALFPMGDMLYLYCECEGTPSPDKLLPRIGDCVDGWRFMDNVYYTCIPASMEQWSRKGEKEACCRIGRLLPDKVASYIKYHIMYMEEGIRKGDKYQYISLLDNTLFIYYESPVEETCLRPDRTGESMVQKEWIKQDPVGHFDHSFSGEANFVDIKAVIAV